MKIVQLLMVPHCEHGHAANLLASTGSEIGQRGQRHVAQHAEARVELEQQLAVAVRC